MKYDKSVYRSLALITQFGINMLVPVFLCTFAGIWLGRKFSVEWIVIPLFLAGALAGFRNIFIMARKIYEKDAVSAKVPSIYSKQCNTKERRNGHPSMGREQLSDKERRNGHSSMGAEQLSDKERRNRYAFMGAEQSSNQEGDKDHAEKN